MNDSTVIADSVIIIKPRSGWSIVDLKELIEYRDLFYFLVWRDVKVLYAQTILGLAWAILNPLIQIAIFTIIFGNIAKLPSEGIPYIVFTSLAIIPWTYVSINECCKSKPYCWTEHARENLFPKTHFPFKWRML